MDELNTLFLSRDPMKVVEFYSRFSDVEQLIEWMRDRPSGVADIVEVEGDREVVIVIPTADSDGDLATHCRQIFAGLQIVFVDSGGFDPYFRGARNVNIGFKRALKHNPRWLVMSSDDMYKIDDVSILREELSRIDPSEVKTVFTQPAAHHSIPTKLARLNKLGIAALSMMGRARRFQLQLNRKFMVDLHSVPIGYYSFLFGSGFKSPSLADFAILSGSYVNGLQGNVYDETYVNAAEDVDLSLALTMDRRNYRFIDYRIGDYIGSSLGRGVDRRLRDVAGCAYLNYKLRMGLHPISGVLREANLL